MSDRFTAITPNLYAYVVEHSMPAGPLVQELSAETEDVAGGASVMQIGSDEGGFLQLLVQICGAKRAVEVGTFTGTSALSIARGLPEDGTLLCCDVNEEWTGIGRKYWERAGLAHKITLKLAPAIETLQALPETERFDFAFIDADKGGYRDYYEEILKRMDSGGVLCIDNVLWMGFVVDPDMDDADTEAIRAFNDFVAQDDRVDVVMLTVGDGVTLIRKK